MWQPGGSGRGFAASFPGSRRSRSMTVPGTPPEEPATLKTPPQVVASPRIRRINSWFTLSTTREERFFLVLAVFIGVFSGLAVVCFRIFIDWSRLALLGTVPEASPLRLILAPVLVSLVVAVLVLHVFPAVRGSGVNQTKAALYIY